MAEQYNSGAAWRVKNKKSERHPGYTGTINVEGTLFFIDCWVKGTGADTFLSFAVKRRDKQEGAAKLDINDDIPQ